MTMKKSAYASPLIAVIAVSASWTGLMVYRQRPALPVAGFLHRSTVDPTLDRGGHTRGIVQVDLMRQIMADRVRAAPATAEPAAKARHRVPSQPHPLLGRPAPALVLEDATGEIRDLGAQAANGPVVVVFYLGATCIACMTSFVELEDALPRFRARGAAVWAVSADKGEFSRERMRRYGSFQFPLLSDPDHGSPCPTVSGSRFGMGTRTRGKPCTGPSSSIAAARSAGPRRRPPVHRHRCTAGRG